jgi:hypothetical protein
LCFNALSITQGTPATLAVPQQMASLKPHRTLPQRWSFWPVTSGHGNCANFAGFSVR